MSRSNLKPLEVAHMIAHQDRYFYPCHIYSHPSGFGYNGVRASTMLTLKVSIKIVQKKVSNWNMIAPNKMCFNIYTMGMFSAMSRG